MIDLRVLKIDTNNFEAWYLKGETLKGIHQYSEALKCYNQSLKLNSDFELALKGKEEVLKLY